MNRFIKALSIVFLLVLCGWSSEKKKQLVVGTCADYPPFAFTSDKKIVGFDIDLAKVIAKKLGYKLHVKDMKFSELMPALRQNKIDLAVAAITVTSKRAQMVDFSTVRYHIPKLALIYLKNNPVTSLRKLENKTIAVQSASIMESFLKERLNVIENVKVVSFERTISIIEDLKEGLVDSILIESDEADIFCLKDKNLGYSLLDSLPYNFNYAVAFPKNSKLSSKINDIMIKLKISNEFDQLKGKWLKSNLTYDVGLNQ